MWNNVSIADIEKARQELELRHERILERHVEEIKSIDDELTEVETLAQMVAAFAAKLKKGPTLAEHPAAARKQDRSAADLAEIRQAPMYIGIR